MGVDNDDLLCNISDPPISSIEMDVENGGYMCCKMLHDRIRSGSRSPFNIIIPALRIKERRSSLKYNISDEEVLKLIAFIDENYSRDFKMTELLQIVPLSRRSIEMRFKKATGQTIYQYLLGVRVERFAYLLGTTDRSYIDIACEVGFRDLANVSRTFKKYKGCTPLEYRKLINGE